MNKYIIFLIFLGLSSCYKLKQENIDLAVKQQLEERRTNFLQEKLSICTREIYSKAQTFADSILRIESKQAKLDSILFPHDTLKPSKPEVLFPDYKKPLRKGKDSLK
ncbi:MAG: hypothetical protein ABIO44_09245 [Saprospiraceae bacterium]